MVDIKDVVVSIIVPAFNEEKRIASSLYSLKDYLDDKPYKSEVLVVDDGSCDSTAEVIRIVDTYCEEMKSQSSCVLIENVKNVGKGYSIAKGMLMAKGDYILFMDADLATPISEMEKLLAELHNGYDIVIGSRRLSESNVGARDSSRMITAGIFSFLVKLMNLTSVSDSQCGFKGYRKHAAQMIAKKQITYGFCFDVEQLHIASKAGLDIAEIPVTWNDKPGSTVVVLRDSFVMLIDLCRIRWLHRNYEI